MIEMVHGLAVDFRQSVTVLLCCSSEVKKAKKKSTKTANSQVLAQTSRSADRLPNTHRSSGKH